MGKVYIGTSGWSYRDWRGLFYPDDLPQRRQLEYASRQLDSLEINGSFYGLLTPDTYRTFYEETPRGFQFAVKGSRFITHNKKLKDAKVPLANFFASGVLLLKEKLGPFVWQLAGNTRLDARRLDEFLGLLPRDTHELANLAQKHDGRMTGRSWTRAAGKHRVRHAIEVRHESFFVPVFVRIARRHGVALVFSDAAEWPLYEEITAGFVYIRLHGARKTYASDYGDAELDRWASRIQTWQSAREPEDARRITDRKPPRRKSRDVYVYFDNDQQAHAPRNALGRAARLGGLAQR